MREKINNEIRSQELRVIGPKGENLGVISRDEALKHAKEFELDLIEVSPKAVPPVAKILDYGKFLYDKSKKERVAKGKSHVAELKAVQITIGTGENDLLLKAKKISRWLKEGHRVRIVLFLRGRAKYMDPKFHKTRLERLLQYISENYKVAEIPKKGPRGVAMIIERQ